MVIRRHALPLVVSAALCAGQVAPLVAQSLADVARQEEARRKEIKEPSRVISNKDLPNVPPAPPAVPDSAAVSRGSTDATGDKDKAGGDKTDKDQSDKDKVSAAGAKDDKAAKDAPKDQAYWSGRQKELQAQLDRDQTLAAAMQTRINALTADFSARDDPAQRGVIGRDRQKAVDELDRLKKAIQDDTKAVADLQEEARRASVPPGWLR